MHTLNPDEYHIGWVCIKAENEAVAARAMLDSKHGYVDLSGQGDPFLYYGGTIGNHNVIIVCTGEAGLYSANAALTNLTRSFPNIKLAILCGIGGGNPSKKHDVRLGDIVVGMPDKAHNGVVQYNAQKAEPGGFVQRVAHNRPPQFILNAVRNRETDILEHAEPWAPWQKFMPLDRKWSSCSELVDVLHDGNTRVPRAANRRTKVHYGLIASGDLVVKCDQMRATLVEQIQEDVLCFEMEAAGMMNTHPCLVVRGISDYCDRHKNDDWQPYASMVAAAYCKYLLLVVHPFGDAHQSPRMSRMSGSFSPSVSGTRSRSTSRIPVMRYTGARTFDLPPKILQGLFLANAADAAIPVLVASFKTYDYALHLKSIEEKRCVGTCEWIQTDADFQWWLFRGAFSVLYMNGEQGIGKTVLTANVRNIIHDHPDSKGVSPKIFVAYSFHGIENATPNTALSVLIHQMLTRFSKIRKPAYEYNYKYLVSNRTYGPMKPLEAPQKTTRSVVGLWNMLVHLAKQITCPTICLLIDGFDCWTIQEQELFLRQCYTTINSSSQIKVLLSSRPLTTAPHNRIVNWESEKPRHFRLKTLDARSDVVRQDLDTYIDAELGKQAIEHGLPSQHQQMIAEHLKTRKSLFLPAAIQLRQIDQAKGSLSSLSEGLEELYQTWYDKMPQQRSPKLNTFLLCLTFAFEPLRNVDYAFACDHAQAQSQHFLSPSWYDGWLAISESIVSQLGPMLIVNKQDDTYEPVHESAKKFLLASSPTKPEHAHGIIARTCMRLLLSRARKHFATPHEDSERQQTKEQRLRAPLLMYAFRHWGQHLAAASIDKGLLADVGDFLRMWEMSSIGFKWQIVSNSGNTNVPLTTVMTMKPIQLLAMLGLSEVLQPLLEHVERTYNLDVQLALVLAINNGYERVVDLLIDHFQVESLDDQAFADVLENSTFSSPKGLLQKIMKLRQPRLMETLAAISAAFSTGDMAKFQLLTENKAIFREQTLHGRTALHLLVIGMSKDSPVSPMQALAEVVFLVKLGVDINQPDVCGFTAMHYACMAEKTANLTLVQGMLDAGADPFAVTKGGLLPLHLASLRSKDPALIECLLNRSQQVSRALSNALNTPLHWAIGRHFTADKIDSEIALMIIKHGGDPYARNRFGATSIDKARTYDGIEVCESGYQKLYGPPEVALLFGSAHARITEYDAIEQSNQTRAQVVKWVKPDTPLDQVIEEYIILHVQNQIVPQQESTDEMADLSNTVPFGDDNYDAQAGAEAEIETQAYVSERAHSVLHPQLS